MRVNVKRKVGREGAGERERRERRGREGEEREGGREGGRERERMDYGYNTRETYFIGLRIAARVKERKKGNRKYFHLEMY